MQEHDPLLPNIRSPQDLSSLGGADLNRLAGEIREQIISTVGRNGGHLASNLGAVELTIALHRVYCSPDDKIIWDVGHQCYAHKLLTGRFGAFTLLRKSGGIAGFPKRSESPHDSFNTGHASTSISAALGILAAAGKLNTGHRVVAVIGDGALTGGMAYEGLSHAGQLGLPLVVILNDNKMSIGPNVGGLSKYLSRLSMKAKYQKARRAIDDAVRMMPFAGDIAFRIMLRLKRAVKAIFYTDNFFVDLGFEYVGPIDGHNISQLSQVIRDARNLDKPVVIHVITRKGKGFGAAEKNPGSYHAIRGEPSAESANGSSGSFTQAFGGAILEAARKDERVVAITAAMEEGTGLSPFKAAYPGRFYDTGIAEEHAVTFAAGLAAGGLRPVAAIYSTFFQRAVDQLIHDVCLQCLPVIFALDRSGFVGGDGETHQGIFDISLCRAAPGLAIFAPAGKEELSLALEWAMGNPSPAIIRYPRAECPAGDPAFSLPIEKGRGVWVRRHDGPQPRRIICIMFTGSLYPQALLAAEILEARGIGADLYNLRFLKPIDEDYLASILDGYGLVVLAEEGTRCGGFGEYVSGLALERNCRAKLIALGASGKFDALGTREELLERNGLDAESIADSAEGGLRECGPESA